MNKQLTKTEKHVLHYISKGMSSKEIAHTLFIAKGTVDKHRKNMLKKLGVKNSSEMVSFVGDLV